MSAEYGHTRIIGPWGLQRPRRAVASLLATEWRVSMSKLYAFVLAPLVLTSTLATSGGQTSGGPEPVVVHRVGHSARAALAPAVPRTVPCHPAKSRQRSYP